MKKRNLMKKHEQKMVSALGNGQTTNVRKSYEIQKRSLVAFVKAHRCFARLSALRCVEHYLMSLCVMKKGSPSLYVVVIMMIRSAMLQIYVLCVWLLELHGSNRLMRI